MGPRLVLNLQHTVDELWTHIHSCQSATEQRRTHIIALVAEGKPPKEVQRVVECSDVTYAKTIRLYNEGGLTALSDKRQQNKGAKPLLSDTELLTLIQAVKNDYQQGIIWNANRMHTFLEELLGREVHVRRAFELLHVVGLGRSRKVTDHQIAYRKRLEKIGASPIEMN